MIHWRPHTQRPEIQPGLAAVSLLVAAPSVHGDPSADIAVLLGIFYFDGSRILSEEDDQPPAIDHYFWCYEREAVANVPCIAEVPA